MNEIQVSENKTLKLTNVLSRQLRPDEMGNIMVVITQMENMMKSNGAQPIGPLIQHVTMSAGPNPEPQIFLLRQATQLLPRVDPGFHMDAVLRVRGCLYAHYTGPMSQSQLAAQKLNIYAFEHDIKLSGSVYSIFVNQDEDDAVMDVFMEIN